MSRSRKFKKPTEKEMSEKYLKANRRGSRDAELEGLTGFTSRTKVHKNKKTYNRKSKVRIEC